MKKAITIFLFFFSSLSFSQFYFDAGLKGGYGLTLLMNKNVTNDSHVVSEFSFGHMFGGKIGLNFNEKYCINLDVSASSFNQAYTIKGDSFRWDKAINIRTLDVAVLFRNYVEGTYFEIGPQYSLVQKATETNSVLGGSDVKKNLEPSYYSAVLGFGAVLGTDNVSLVMGFRATYALSDIVSDKGGRSTVPAYPIDETFYKASYTTYKPSNPLTVRFMAELTFDLGYFTHSTCGKKRTRFVSF